MNRTAWTVAALFAACVLASWSSVFAEDELAGSDQMLQVERQQLQRLEKDLAALRAKAAEGAGDSEVAVPQQASGDTSLTVHRHIGPGGDALYSLHSTHGRLPELLQKLARAAGCRLLIDPEVEQEDLDYRGPLALENVTLREACEILVGVTDLEWSLDGNAISLLPPGVMGFSSWSEYCREKAARLYRIATDKFPHQVQAVQARMRLAQHHVEAGAAAAAAAQLQRIADDFPRHDLAPKALMKAALTLGRLGKADAARTVLHRVAKSYLLQGFASQAHLEIGDLWRGEDQYDNAVRAYQKALDAPGGEQYEEQVQLRLAQVLLQKGDASAALRVLDTLSEQIKDAATRQACSFYRGQALLQLDRPQEAVDQLSAFLREYPASSRVQEAYIRLADALLAQGRLLPALEAYQGVLKAYPDSSYQRYCRYRVGRVYRRLGLTKRAIGAFRQAAAAEEADPKAAVELAECLLEEGEYEQAADMFQRLSDCASDRGMIARAQLGAGDTRFAQQKYPAAAAWYVKALGGPLDPASRNGAFLRLGDCYEQIGQLSRALLAYSGKLQ